MTPGDFQQMLKTRQFARGEMDAVFVAQEYAETFKSVMGSCRTLTYSDLSWGDCEASLLARALPFCSLLTTLFLNNNEIGDAGAKGLAAAFSQGTSVRHLFLESNRIGDAGAEAMASALSGCSLQDRLPGPRS